GKEVAAAYMNPVTAGHTGPGVPMRRCHILLHWLRFERRSLASSLGRTKRRCHPSASIGLLRSAALQRDVLIGRCPGIAAEQPYCRLADSWPDAAQRRHLPERRRDDLFLHKLLNLQQ